MFMCVCVCERVTIALTWTGLKRGTSLKLEASLEAHVTSPSPSLPPLHDEICLGTLGKILVSLLCRNC